MNLKEITVTYGGKLNLSDYNSAHIELSATALVDEGESLEQVSNELFNVCRAQVRAKALEFYDARRAKVNEVFAGLPVEVQQQIKEG
jgi:hypothetical protein